jgi:pyrroloquinoline quinone (PQQ) biosynthesis protein C
VQIQVKLLIREAMQAGKTRPRHIQRYVLERDQSPDDSEIRARLRQALEIDKLYNQLDAMVQLGEATRVVTKETGPEYQLKGRNDEVYR